MVSERVLMQLVAQFLLQLVARQELRLVVTSALPVALQVRLAPGAAECSCVADLLPAMLRRLQVVMCS